MINAQDKAKELFEKYYDMKWQSYRHKKTSIKSMTKLSCKQCALIAQQNLLDKLNSLGIKDKEEEQVLLEINAL